jgi:hypothetical protein
VTTADDVLFPGDLPLFLITMPMTKEGTRARGIDNNNDNDDDDNNNNNSG